MEPRPAPDRPLLDPAPAEPGVTWLGPVVPAETLTALAVDSNIPMIWLVFFGLNLIVPLLLGAGMCGPLGVLGLIAAVGFSGTFGFQYLKAYPAVQTAALTGAIVVALSQFMPVLQFGAGILGLTVAGMMETGRGRVGSGQLGLVGGFYATFMTGQILTLVSLIIGGAFQLVGRGFHMIIRLPSPPPPGKWETGQTLEPAEPAGHDGRGG